MSAAVNPNAPPPGLDLKGLDQLSPPWASDLNANVASAQKERTAAEGDLNAASEDAPAPPTEDDTTTQAPQPQRNIGQLIKFVPWLIALAALGGSRTKVSANALLASTNGMLKGLVQGDEQQYEDSWNKWQAEQKQLAELQKQKWDVYRQMVQVYKDRIDGKERALQVAEQAVRDARTDRSQSMQAYYQSVRAALALKDESRKWAALDEMYRRDSAAIADRAAKADAAKAAASGGGSVDQVAKLIAEYKYPPLSGWTMRSAWGQQVMAKVGQLNPTYDSKVYTAEVHAASAAGGIEGKVAYAGQELTRLGPVAQQIASDIPRGSFVPINKLLQMSDRQLSDPKLIQLKISVQSLLNAYNLLAARAGTSKEEREKNDALLTGAESQEGFTAGVQQFMVEAAASSAAAQAAISEVGATGGEYKTKDDVVAAYKSGKLSYQEAAAILQGQFGAK